METFTLVDQAKKKEASVSACFTYGHSISVAFRGDCSSVKKGLEGRELSVKDFYWASVGSQ